MRERERERERESTVATADIERRPGERESTVWTAAIEERPGERERLTLTLTLGKERHKNKRGSVDSEHTQPCRTHTTTPDTHTHARHTMRSLTLAPRKERHTRRNADPCPPQEPATPDTT